MGFLTHDKTEAEKIYITVGWGIQALLHGVSFVWYLRRRHIDVIAVRNVPAVCVFMLALWTAVSIYLIRNPWAEQAECEGKLWLWWINSWAFLGITHTHTHTRRDVLHLSPSLSRSLVTWPFGGLFMRFVC